VTAIAGPWLLRAFNPDDTARLTEAFTDPEIARWSLGGLVDGDVVGWWTRYNDPTDETRWSRAISVPDGSLLGQIAIIHIDRRTLTADVGYMVLPHARHNGVATWAVGQACSHAFGALGLRRLQLFHAIDNPGSCAVARSSRFALEGTLRESYRYGDGLWHDEHLHARLASDLPPR
jgi:RimJ/RimL family protein N-acetyltransferase